jgi:hypothetical protein
MKSVKYTTYHNIKKKYQNSQKECAKLINILDHMTRNFIIVAGNNNSFTGHHFVIPEGKEGWFVPGHNNSFIACTTKTEIYNKKRLLSIQRRKARLANIRNRNKDLENKK